ncbi:Pentatricopeptide repeat-containing protein, chloroplastic [Sesamum angolense]|uniref:Pentatricopeptide repeat-containing protein, chloroplastic n=1 Tax=Sesamum angolense TaxID=2727404 RepID=A0AAE2BPS2_9LAMI|nr:Pentatricopeptide repeat-containing protein, chloroplastic [Sesamum angolense]
MNAFSFGKSNLLKNSNLFLSIKSHALYFSNSTSEILRSQSLSLPEKVASYLENCPDTSSLKKLHAWVITQGLDGNVFVGSKLLHTLAKFNLLTESKWVFNKIINNNLSVWNSIIVGYFRADQHNDVLGVYVNLRQKNIGVHGSAITFGLKSCVELGAYEFGRNLHTDAFKFGLSCDQFVGSSLIGFYSKCDQIEGAAKVFDEIIDRDVVAYTSIITGYAQVGDCHTDKAFSVARDMQRDGFEPNRVTLVSLLQCASRLGALDGGRSIHGYAIRRGIGCLDEVFETSIMDMYIKCGDLHGGTVIFDKMSRKTSGSWNALISGHLQLGQPLEACNLFLQMVNKCNLDLIALANGLLTCADLGYLLLGKAIHCRILHRGVHLDLVGTTALIDMYCKCKHLSAAMNIFHRTDTKDDALFNVMIAGYLRNGCAFRAIETFCEMVAMCVRPNTGTIISVLSALSDMGGIRTCKCVHGYVFRQGLEANVDIANQLITMYAKFGIIKCARQVFDSTKKKDKVSWTSMMTGLVNHGLANEAMTLFGLMQRENQHPDAVTFTCLLQALNQLGSVTLAKEVHGQFYRVFLEKDITLMNSLIATYSKWGKLKMASHLFEHMAEKHLSSWNTMIAAYGMHGDCVQALKLMDQMKNKNVAPDGVTFKSILSACSHCGFVEEGLYAYRSMQEEYGITPSDEHYGCMVDLLSRAGRLEEAYNLLKHDPSRRNASTIAALLAACRIHGNTEMGERVGQWLLDIEPQNASAYCSVSNFYAGEGKWDEVAHLGAAAKGKGLKRTPGYSLIYF